MHIFDNLVNSAYFVTSTSPRAFSVSVHDRYVTYILKMCMKKFNAEKNLKNLQGFDMHIIARVYCKPCLQPISCSFYCFLQNFLGHTLDS